MKKLISRIAMLAVCVVVMGSTATDVQAAQSKKPPPPTRYVDNLDGTITDTQTGLMWEKKTGTVGDPIVGCSTLTNCPDPHDVNNYYAWSSTNVTPYPPDGSVFINFLAKMNCNISADGTCDFSKYTDWRIPTVEELRSILLAVCPPLSPCIDSVFGSTASSGYMTSSTLTSDPSKAWFVNFSDGVVDTAGKNFNTSAGYVRAVRGSR